jgi:hypothetical protein
VRLLGLLIVVWLLIGAAAAGQRHYFDGHVSGCSELKTIAETIVAGPLNYMGMDPKASCTMPQPSKG